LLQKAKASLSAQPIEADPHDGLGGAKGKPSNSPHPFEADRAVNVLPPVGGKEQSRPISILCHVIAEGSHDEQ
jgi:hypothetical protein